MVIIATMIQNEHEEKIVRIRQAVKRFHTEGKPFRIFHGSTNSTRILSFKQSEMIDTSDLNEIIAIDTDRQTALVQPNVPMDKLVNATLRHGLVPPVIPEFPGITVGGAIQGGAGESSSFKWGFFSQATNKVEYICGNGEQVTASAEENADLFYGAAGSCGTLGVITAAEIQLIPAKRYVHLQYLRVQSPKEAIELMQTKAAEKQYDFMDAILFSGNCGLVIVGTLSDEKTGNFVRFGRARDQWFYLHAEEISKTNRAYAESVPLKDYLFRYDRGAFWVGRFAFELFGVPFNRFMRFLLDPILHTRKLYQALQDSGASQQYIVQDLTLPVEHTGTILRYIDETLGVYPLWLCPVKPEPRSPLLCNGIETSLAMNIGVWGPRIEDYNEFKKTNRELEAKLAALGGKKWMYAHTYYTEEEFWKVYDKSWYDNLRQKYDASKLPTIHDKVVVREHYPVNAKRGLMKTMFGIAGLRIEK